MPTVSVIIPAYNSENFICQAIQSALDQSYRDIEIIVVDDGSTDGTEKIVRGFCGPITYHRQKNHGAGMARTTGVNHASGEWIAFLDSDDVWHPDKLALQLREAGGYRACPFVYSDMDAIDANGNVIAKQILKTQIERRTSKNKSSINTLVFNKLPFPYPSTVLLKRDIFLSAGGFSPSFKGHYHEDFELFGRLAQEYKFHFMSQSLVQYRILPSQAKDEFKNRNWLVLLGHLWQLWAGCPEKQASLLPHYNKYYSDQGKVLLRLGKYQEARRYFRIGFGYCPWGWKNLSRWALSYLPLVRKFYRFWKRRKFARVAQSDGAST